MEAMHKFLDHTADIFFVAKAETLPELFRECALALEETMVELSAIKLKQKVKILGEADNPERLLFDFLDELVFFKDYKQLLFSQFDIDIREKQGKYTLTCIAFGEKLDLVRHRQRVDVKAITMHEFKVEQLRDGWKAKVLVDI